MNVNFKMIIQTVNWLHFDQLCFPELYTYKDIIPDIKGAVTSGFTSM